MLQEVVVLFHPTTLIQVRVNASIVASWRARYDEKSTRKKIFCQGSICVDDLDEEEKRAEEIESVTSCSSLTSLCKSID